MKTRSLVGVGQDSNKNDKTHVRGDRALLDGNTGRMAASYTRDTHAVRE
jgi:hypothetical protein